MEMPFPDAGFHQPVLVEAVLNHLIKNPSGVYVDGTLGGGGHAKMILDHLEPEGKLIGIDRDKDAIEFCQGRLSAYGDQVRIVHSEFARVYDILLSQRILEIDGILLDLGVSSHQINESRRGFSYLQVGPLAMQMDAGDSKSAGDIVNSYSQSELADLFYYYGEERKSRQIAKRIVMARDERKIETTQDLANIIRRGVPFNQQVKVLSRVFQAIRIEVNNEIQQLKDGLSAALKLLKIGGRIVVISYHSLEDRLVKQFFRGQSFSLDRHAVPVLAPVCPFKLLTKNVVRPSKQEIEQNSRARSARLRAAEKVI